MEELIGQTVEGRYELRRLISESGRAAVFGAKHRFTEQDVAIKLLQPLRARDQIERQALLGEARLLSEIRHPCIVEVVDAGVTQLPDADDPAPFLVMDLVDGRDVHGMLATRGRLDIPEVVGIGLAVCRALAMMRRWGVVHRDITPTNIIVPPTRPWERHWETGTADAKVLGFGAAAYALVTEGPRDSGFPDVAYRAPELLVGSEPDHKSDLFALAVVMYESLTDQLPLGRDVPPPHELRDDVPRHVSDALVKALSKDPEARHEGPKEFAEALWEARSTITPRSVPGVQRRQSARAPYLTPLRLVRTEGHLAGRCEDISAGGMLVLTTMSLPQGETLAVQFAVPGKAGLVSEDAVVRWNRQGRQGACVLGLQFVEPKSDVTAAIERYVSVFGEEPKAGAGAAARDAAG